MSEQEVELQDLTQSVHDLEVKIHNLTQREKATDEYVVQLEAKLAQAAKDREHDLAVAANQQAKAAKVARDLRNAEAYIEELEAKLVASEDRLRRLLDRSTPTTPADHPPKRSAPEAPAPAPESDATSDRDATPPGDGGLAVAEDVMHEMQPLLGALGTVSQHVEELVAENDALRDRLRVVNDENAHMAETLDRLSALKAELSTALAEGPASALSFAEETLRSDGKCLPAALDVPCVRCTAAARAAVDEAPRSAPALETKREPLLPWTTTTTTTTTPTTTEGGAEEERRRQARALSMQVCAKTSLRRTFSEGDLASLTANAGTIKPPREAGATSKGEVRSVERANAAERFANVSRATEEPSAVQAVAARRKSQTPLEPSASAPPEVLRETEASRTHSRPRPRGSQREIDERREQLEACVSRLHDELATSKEAYDALSREQDGKADADVVDHERLAQLEACLTRLQSELGATRKARDALLLDRLEEAKEIYADFDKKDETLDHARTELEGALARERDLENRARTLESVVANLQSALHARSRKIVRISEQRDVAASEANLLRVEMRLRCAMAEQRREEDAKARSDELQATKRRIAHLERAAELVHDEDFAERRHQKQPRRRRHTTDPRRSPGGNGRRCLCRERERAALAARIEELEAALRKEVARADAAGHLCDAAYRDRVLLLQRLRVSEAKNGPSTEASSPAPRRSWAGKKGIWHWR